MNVLSHTDRIAVVINLLLKASKSDICARGCIHKLTEGLAELKKLHKPGWEEGFGQKMRNTLLTELRYPSAGKVGIN